MPCPKLTGTGLCRKSICTGTGWSIISKHYWNIIFWDNQSSEAVRDIRGLILLSTSRVYQHLNLPFAASHPAIDSSYKIVMLVVPLIEYQSFPDPPLSFGCVQARLGNLDPRVWKCFDFPVWINRCGVLLVNWESRQG